MRSGFVLIADVQRCGARGGNRCIASSSLAGCALGTGLHAHSSLLFAGCVSPRAEVQKTPIVPVSNISPADGPTVRSAAAEQVEGPQIEALPPVSEPITTASPIPLDHVNPECFRYKESGGSGGSTADA